MRADVKTFQLDCNKCRDAAAGFAVRQADRQTLIWPGQEEREIEGAGKKKTERCIGHDTRANYKL